MINYNYRLFLTNLSKDLICELDYKTLEYTEYLTTQDELSFSIDRNQNGILVIFDSRFDLVKNLYWILLEKYSGDTLSSSSYFSIVEPEQTYDGGKSELRIKAIGIDYQEFNRRKIRGYSQPSVTLYGALSYVAATPLYGTWTIGATPTNATSEFHTIDVSEETVTTFLEKLSREWNCFIIPDTVNNVINSYSKSIYGSQTDIVLSSSNFVDNASFSPKLDQLTTRLYVYGANGVDISSVNPKGVAFVDDFSYFTSYMSPSLLGEYNTYLAKVTSYGSSFASLISTLEIQQNDLLSLENDLSNLNTQKAIYDDAMTLLQTTTKRNNAAYDAIYVNWQANNSLISAKESAITNKEADIIATQASISAIHADLAYTNLSNFSAPNLVELSKYIYENTLNVDTISDIPTLYNYGVAYLTAVNQPKYEIEIDSIDLFSIQETQNIRNQIKVGDKIWLDIPEVSLEYVSLSLVSYSHDPIGNKLSFRFSNTSTLENSLYYMKDLFTDMNISALEVKNNSPTWGEYVLDKPSIQRIDEEIDATTTIVRMGNGNVIDRRGFTGSDIGGATNGEIRIKDDKIIFSKDAWQTYYTLLGAQDGLYLENDDVTTRVVITPDYGIQVDRNFGTPATPNWGNQFFVDTNGQLYIQSRIWVGNSLSNIVIDEYGLDPLTGGLI